MFIDKFKFEVFGGGVVWDLSYLSYLSLVWDRLGFCCFDLGSDLRKYFVKWILVDNGFYFEVVLFRIRFIGGSVRLGFICL